MFSIQLYLVECNRYIRDGGSLGTTFQPIVFWGQKKHPTMAYNEADHSGRTENVPPATASILWRLGVVHK